MDVPDQPGRSTLPNHPHTGTKIDLSARQMNDGASGLSRRMLRAENYAPETVRLYMVANDLGRARLLCPLCGYLQGLQDLTRVAQVLLFALDLEFVTHHLITRVLNLFRGNQLRLEHLLIAIQIARDDLGLLFPMFFVGFNGAHFGFRGITIGSELASIEFGKYL
ncbi:MAG: hypothetical protein ABJC51_05575, partial [Acidobacteriota bacterium]